MKNNLGFLLLFLFPAFLFAQKNDGKELPLIQKKDSAYVGEVKIGNKSKFTPFIAPGLNPEVGFMLTAGGLFSFSLEPLNIKLQRSSLPFSIGYSTNGSLNASFRPAFYTKKDNYRISGDIWIKFMPDNYWGVGYDKGKAKSKPDSTTAYHKDWTQVYLKITRKIKEGIYAGIILDFNKTKATKLNETMQEDPNVLKDGTFVRNRGIGLVFQYDTRDVIANPYKGLLMEFSSAFYGKFLGGQHIYQVLTLDYRQYKTIVRPGRTLAWQGKIRYGLNDIPWPEMSMVGTQFDLRGYTWGRYRDKSMAFGIVEYRHMFMRKKPRKKTGSMMSKFGFATWLATGTVAPNIREIKHFLPNGGFGIRFEVQHRMNARVDLGIGEDTYAVYVSFNEAF